MTKSSARAVGIFLAGILGAAAAPLAIAQGQDSGFLRDYSRLKEAKDASGKTIRAWASPKLTPASYNAIMIDPLMFYPEPRPSEQVSADALKQLLGYANELLRKAVADRFNVVNQPGPGVVRLRIAFSGVAAKGEGLKPYQYVPIAFVATMASRAATGGAPQRAVIVVEGEVTDAVSGELLASRVKVGTGERLAKVEGKDKVTLENVKPLLDELAANAFPELQKYVKPK